MTKDKAFEIIKGMHISGDYYELDDTLTCLDGNFSTEELKAVVFVMENKMSKEMEIMINEFMIRVDNGN